MASPGRREHVAAAAARIVLFASTQAEQRARRPTDIALAITSVLLFIIISVLTTLDPNLDEAFAGVLADSRVLRCALAAVVLDTDGLGVALGHLGVRTSSTVAGP